MGTWGTGSFENDSAADFVKEVVEDGVVALREALEVVLDADVDFVEGEEGARAVCAAEIVAAVTSGDFRYIPDDDLIAWLEECDRTEFTAYRGLARDALERVLGSDSELPELWDESDDREIWHGELQRLRATLA